MSDEMRWTVGPVPCPFCGKDCGIVELDGVDGEHAAHTEPQCPDFMVRDGTDFIRAAGKKMEEKRLKNTPRA